MKRNAKEDRMLLSKNADVNAIAVKAIEGETVYGGDLMVKPMLKGDEMSIMEVHYTPGVGAPLHSHTHESLVYVVKGRVKTQVGDETYILAPGDVCRHPAGVMHGVEALEEAVTIEVKAPAPDIANFFKT
jgi:quercetin dioxygenase-like cupin family protein